MAELAEFLNSKAGVLLIGLAVIVIPIVLGIIFGILSGISR